MSTTTPSAADRVYAQVKRDILGGGLPGGSLVTEGTVKRNKPIRVLRNSVVIFEGELESLRRFKDIVEEVKSGTECGIAVKAYNDVQPGDQIECFERIEVKRSL